MERNYGWEFEKANENVTHNGSIMYYTHPFWGNVIFAHSENNLRLTNRGTVNVYPRKRCRWKTENPEATASAFFQKLDERKPIFEKLTSLCVLAAQRFDAFYSGQDMDRTKAYPYPRAAREAPNFLIDEEDGLELGVDTSIFEITYKPATEDVAVSVRDDIWEWSTTVKYQDFNAEEILNAFEDAVHAVRHMAYPIVNSFYAAKEDFLHENHWAPWSHFTGIDFCFNVSGANSTKVTISGGSGGMNTLKLVRKNRNLQKLNGAAYFKRYIKGWLEQWEDKLKYC